MGLDLWLGLGLVYKYSNSMIFKNSLSASWLVRKLSSTRLDWQQTGLSVNCPVSLPPADISTTDEQDK